MDSKKLWRRRDKIDKCYENAKNIHNISKNDLKSLERHSSLIMRLKENLNNLKTETNTYLRNQQNKLDHDEIQNCENLIRTLEHQISKLDNSQIIIQGSIASLINRDSERRDYRVLFLSVLISSIISISLYALGQKTNEDHDIFIENMHDSSRNLIYTHFESILRADSTNHIELYQILTKINNDRDTLKAQYNKIYAKINK